MATANPTPPDRGVDNFVLELGRVREQIIEKFVELIDCVKARECKLLKELDTILASFHSYRDEARKQGEKKQNVERTKIFLIKEMKSTAVKGLHENVLTQAEKELNSIKFLPEPKMVHFVCENNKMFAEVNKLGELVKKVKSMNYKSKVHPVVSVCERGNRMEQLHYPLGVTVYNETSNIYVADCKNHCVKVFDKYGKILFKFGDNDGEGKMLYPKGLVITGDRIMISNAHFADCFILIYQLNGYFVSKIGKYGNSEIEFNDPRGLASSESNGDIYICDYGNNRIQILSKELQFKSQFGADKLKYPRDVKLSKEYIYILDEYNPCIHLYDYNLILQKSVVSRGKGMQVIDPWYFYIDDFNNILISDHLSKSIQIFNPEFEMIHKLNTASYPKGVAVDNLGRIMIVCQASDDCLQIF